MCFYGSIADIKNCLKGSLSGNIKLGVAVDDIYSDTVSTIDVMANVQKMVAEYNSSFEIRFCLSSNFFNKMLEIRLRLSLYFL